MSALLAQLHSLNHWQIDFTATALLLQGVVLAIVPEEIVIATMGYLWRTHHVSFVEAMLAIQIGLLPANAAMVFIANRLGPRIFAVAPFKWFLKKSVVEKSMETVRKHAPRIAFLTRFTPTIRGPVYVALGLSKTDVLGFMRIDAVASMIQVPLLLAVGSVL